MSVFYFVPMLSLVSIFENIILTKMHSSVFYLFIWNIIFQTRNGKKSLGSEEMCAVLDFLKIHIKNKIVHSKKDCDEFISKYTAVQSGPWINIKHCVKNLIKKNRKMVNFVYKVE